MIPNELSLMRAIATHGRNREFMVRIAITIVVLMVALALAR